jgi:hypothetical protein
MEKLIGEKGGHCQICMTQIIFVFASRSTVQDDFQNYLQIVSPYVHSTFPS